MLIQFMINIPSENEHWYAIVIPAVNFSDI